MQQDPKLVQRIKDQFIPVVYNTYEMFQVNSVSNSWLQRYGPLISNNLAPSVKEKTWQGYYILGADGTGYGYWHPGHMGDSPTMATGRFGVLTGGFHQVLDVSLERFRTHPPKSINTEDLGVGQVSTLKPDPTTSVIRVLTRLPCDDPGDPFLNNIGRDFFWIYRSDVQELLEAADAATQTFDFPEQLKARLTRFHLRDHSRAMRVPWMPEHVHKARYSVSKLSDLNGMRRFRFSGEFAMSQSFNAIWGAYYGMSYQGNIEGEFSIDPVALRVVRWRVYAEGPCRGEPAPHDPTRQTDFTLMIGMKEADDAEAKEYAPVGFSWQYPHNLRGKPYKPQEDYRYPAGVPKSRVASAPTSGVEASPSKVADGAITSTNLLEGVGTLSAWQVQQLEGGKASIGTENDALQMVVTAGGSASWHVGLHQADRSLQDGKNYHLHFEAKAGSEWKMWTGFGIQGEDYHSAGLAEAITVPTEWKTFDFDFTATGTRPNRNAFYIDMGGRTGTVWVRKISLAEAAGSGAEKETRDRSNVPNKAVFDEPGTIKKGQDRVPAPDAAGGNLLKGVGTISAWQVQQLEGGKGSLNQENDAIRVVVTAGGTLSWHVGLRQANLNLSDGKRYRLHFEAKADSEWKMAAGLMTQDAPYQSIGLGAEITVPTKWKTFECTFTATNTHPDHNVFFIDMGPRTGTAWMRNFSLTEER